MIRPGSRVSEFSVPLTDGTRFDVHAPSPKARYTILEIYRGFHCGVCKAHLQTLASMKDDFAAHDARIVAVSMNEQSLAEKAQRMWGLEDIDVGYALDEPTARGWGLCLSKRFRETEPPLFSEPATFVIRADHVLYAADIRTSPHIRPDLDRLLTLVRRATEGYPVRGAD